MAENKPSVLQLVKGLDIGSINGGSDRFALDLSFALARLGYPVSVCVFYRHGTPTEALWLEKIRAAGVDMFWGEGEREPSTFAAYRKSLAVLSDYLSKHSVDILHSHFQQGSLIALLLKRKFKIPVLLRTVHNTREWDPNLAGDMRNLVISKHIYPLCMDAEVAVSQALVEQLARYPGNKARGRQPYLIFNGFALPGKRPAPAQNTDKTRDVFTLGSVGRLCEQKGMRYLIAAMPEVLQAHANTRLLLVGDGELRAELEAQVAALGLAERVTFVGRVPDVSDYYARMDLFVSSSLWEGLPTVIMEAISQGLPIVATDIPGTREIITDGENGWLAEPTDAHALALAIIAAMDSPEMRAAYRHNAIERLGAFDIDKIASQYAALYASLLERKQGRKKEAHNDG